MQIEKIDANSGLEHERTAIEDALLEVGLTSVEAPRPGTEAYRRVVEAANGYMNEVRRVEKPPSLPSVYDDNENYFRPQKKATASSSSDTPRRDYHDQLAKMLSGKSRKELSRSEADQISNFAAYLTGQEEYVDAW